ncbi:hypothetical protein E4T56_gene3964 [Termitomyces sp. T112]|nr:hypothetical protein E4T56_gene3964 [Termitomyces sp. T112]
MSYRNRLRSATIAQSAAARAPEVDRGKGLTQEAPSELTELDISPKPTSTTAASSRRADDLPACKADAPEPVAGGDAHFVESEGTSAERQSGLHDEKSSTDEYCDTYSHLTVDTDRPVFGSNNIISGESTPVQINKKLRYQPPGKEDQVENPQAGRPGLSPDQESAVSFARQSMTDEERED